MSPTKIPTVELHGSPEAMGVAHAAAVGPLVEELVDARLKLITDSLGVGARIAAREVAEHMSEQIAQFAPNVFAETTATAREAGVEYWKLIVAGAVSDVLDVVSRNQGRGANSNHECTLIAAETVYGNAILGTWDSHFSAIPGLVLCRRRPSTGLSTLALSTAGWPMQQGLTSNHTSFAIANLVSKKVGDGLPFIAALPNSCEAGHVEEATKLLLKTPHASGRFYLFCSGDAICAIEIAPGQDPIVVTNQYVCHTNHYVFLGAPDREGRPAELQSSQRRRSIGSSFAAHISNLASPEELLIKFAESGVVQLDPTQEDRTGVVYLMLPQAGRMLYTCPDPSVSPSYWPVQQENL